MNLLKRMERLGLVSLVRLGIGMRDQRNRIMREYLPGKIRQICEELAGRLSKALLSAKEAGAKIRFDNA